MRLEDFVSYPIFNVRQKRFCVHPLYLAIEVNDWGKGRNRMVQKHVIGAEPTISTIRLHEVKLWPFKDISQNFW